MKHLTRKLKKKSANSPDGIDSHVLKLSIDIIAAPLTSIINRSLRSGIVPSSWKKARIVPIHKSGAKDECANYRPISCLNIAAKVLETAAKVQIVQFFEENKLYAISQHGFRSKRSTTSALINMHSTWSNAADKKQFAGVLAFDLSSAFDCIDIEIICNKLKIYGFDTISINWIKSYLTERSQFVQIGGEVSTTLIVVIGSPQGSVISPCSVHNLYQ